MHIDRSEKVVILSISMIPKMAFGLRNKIAASGIQEQDHLRMNVATDLKNHLRSIDLFRSMIIKKNKSKVCDSHWIVMG